MEKLPRKRFTGRRMLINQIQSALENCKSQQNWANRIIVLYGIGGIGKTAIAQAFVNNYYFSKQKHSHIAWVDAENDAVLEASFRTLAKELQLNTPHQRPEHTAVTLFNYFSEYVEEGVIIYDNVDPQYMHWIKFKKFLPTRYLRRRPLVLIISSEYPDWEIPKQNKISVAQLDHDDSMQFLNEALELNANDVQACGEKHFQCVQELSQLLAGIPLSLELAASVMLMCTNSGHSEIEAVVKEYIREANKQETLLPRGYIDNSLLFRISTQAAFNVTLHIVSGLDPNSIIVLNFLAYLPPGYVAMDEVQTLLDYNNLPISTANTCKILQHYSLITIHHERRGNFDFNAVSIHRLIQSYTREILANGNEYAPLTSLCKYYSRRKSNNIKIPMLYLHQHLKVAEWKPTNSIEYSIIFGATLICEDSLIVAQETALKMIQDVCNFISSKDKKSNVQIENPEIMKLLELCVCYFSYHYDVKDSQFIETSEVSKTTSTAFFIDFLPFAIETLIMESMSVLEKNASSNRTLAIQLCFKVSRMLLAGASAMDDGVTLKTIRELLRQKQVSADVKGASSFYKWLWNYCANSECMVRVIDVLSTFYTKFYTLNKTLSTKDQLQYSSKGGPFDYEKLMVFNPCNSGEEIIAATEPSEVQSPAANRNFKPPSEPKPLQIMRLESEYSGGPLKVTCDEAAFESIVGKTGNRRVAVLAVAGPTRKGKSFFLNFVLRRLKGIVNDDEDWMGWNKDDCPRTGFTWNENDDRVTDGIWMWSEPFTLKSKTDGSEFDVILMDTQGVFDDMTGKREWSILMGLSLLTSSCLVYNTTNNIDEKDLQILDEFLSFGLMALQDTNNTGRESPFQKFVFLIRDLTNPGQYPYGPKGGKAFIDKTLSSRDTHQDDNSMVRANLVKCFSKISCVLLPYPGPDVIHPHYDGSLRSCKEFAEAAESCIDDILFQGDLPTKKINGNFLIGQDLLTVFKTYVDMFNEDRVLTSESIFCATSKACNSAIVSRCLSTFVLQVQAQLVATPYALESDLEDIFVKEKGAAIKNFEISRKMGSRRVIDEAKDELCKVLKRSFESIKSQYVIDRLNKVKTASYKAVTKYVTTLKERLPTGLEFLDETELLKLSQSAQSEALDIFIKFINPKKTDILQDEVAELKKILQEKCTEFQQENNNKKSNAEKKIQSEVSLFVQQYSSAMNSRIKGRLLKTNKLDSIHAKVLSAIEKEFAQKHFESSLFTMAQQLLQTEIREKMNNFREKMSKSTTEAKTQADSLLSQAVGTYRTQLIAESGSDVNEFKAAHSRILEASTAILKAPTAALTKELRLKTTIKLVSKAHEIHINLLSSIYENTFKFHKDISMAKEAARTGCEEFIRNFCDHNQKLILVNPMKSEEKQEECLEQARGHFLETLKSMGVDLTQSDQETELTNLASTINNLFQKQIEVNAKRKKEAENYITKAAAQSADEYTRDLKDAFEGRIVTEQEVREVHDAVSKLSIDDFTKRHSNALLYPMGEKVLLERIQISLDQFLGQMSAAINELNEEGNKLLTQLLASYEANLQRHIGTDDQAAFHSCHLKCRDEAISTFLNSFKKSQNHVEHFQGKLETLIETCHGALLESFTQAKFEIHESIEQAKKAATNGYVEAMEGLFLETDEFVDEDTLLAQHNFDKAAATVALKASYKKWAPKLSNAKETEQTGLSNLQGELKTLFGIFQRKNQERKSQFIAVVEDQLRTYMDLYTNEMAIKMNGKLVSPPEITTYHLEASTRALEKYEESNAYSQWKEEGRKMLVRQLKDKRDVYQAEAETALEISKTAGAKLGEDALKSYKDAMMNFIHVTIQQFQEAHHANRDRALGSMQTSSASTSIHESVLPSFILETRSQIESHFNQLLSDKKQADSQLLTIIEEASTLYRNNLQAYFSQTKEPVVESKVDAKHKHLADDAANSLKSKCKDIQLYAHCIDRVLEMGLKELIPKLALARKTCQEEHVRRIAEAERQINTQMTGIAEQYTVDMLLLIDDKIVSQKQLSDYHRPTIQKAIDKFARRHSNDPNFPDIEKKLLSKLNSEFNQLSEKMAKARDDISNSGEALVARALDYYQGKILSKSTTEEEADFQKSHSLIKEFAIELLKTSGKITNPDALKMYQSKLKLQIDAMYKELVQNLTENIIKARDALLTAKQNALISYEEAMEALISRSAEHTDDASLEKQHSYSKDEALKILKAFSFPLPPSSKLQNEHSSCVHELGTQIDNLYAQLVQKNKAKMATSQQTINDEVQKQTKKYAEALARSVGEGPVPDELLEKAHDQVREQCMQTFEELHSKSVFFQPAYQKLNQNINVEKQNLKDRLLALVQASLTQYNDAMMTVLGSDDKTFENAHEINKKAVLSDLNKSILISHPKYYEIFVNKLQVELLKAHVKLLGSHHQCKSELGASVFKAKEEAWRTYEATMHTFFTQNEDPVVPSTLKEKHILNSKEAHNSLERTASGSRGRSFEMAREQAVKDLDEKIRGFYEKLEQSNALRLQKYETSVMLHLSGVKDEYAASLGKVANETFEETELEREHASKLSDCERLLLSKINEKLVAPELITSVLQQLREFTDRKYAESRVVLQFRIKDNESTVNVALGQAAKYYNDEMNKKFHAKDWFEPKELSELNEQIISAAVQNCKTEVLLTDIQERQLRDAMAVVYLKYSEDNTLRYPVEHPAIGIDLGTTYSCVAVCINGEVKIIPNREVDNGSTLPSYVAFNADHTIDVGEVAKDQAFTNPENTIFDAKRLIGRSFKDPVVQKDIKFWPFTVVDDQDKPKIKAYGVTYRPEEISAKILFKIKTMAEAYLNKEVKEAVVTVPAYFNDGQRQATRDAAEIAGLKVKILNEPTSAAIAYKLHRTDELERNVLIFDLGGGTFDVAILKIKGKDIKVLATGGDTHLGGEDFDNAIVDCIIERVKNSHSKDLARGRHSTDVAEKAKASERLRRIRDRSEAAKRNLSSSFSTVISIDRIDGDFDLKETLTREEFEHLNQAQFKACIEVVKESLKDAKLEKTDIDDIVLVGGSTRIPKIQQLLKEFFDNKKELCSTINPDEAVALGAAIQAALLHGEQATRLKDSVKLSDVTPLSLGNRVVTGELSVIIPKNTPVPCSRTKTFETVNDNQASVTFKIYEGENLKIAKDNNFLGFEVNGIPKGPAGSEKLDCTMTIDDEGILHIKAVSQSNKKEGDITIETYNERMTKEEIKQAQSKDPLKW